MKKINLLFLFFIEYFSNNYFCKLKPNILINQILTIIKMTTKTKIVDYHSPEHLL